MRYKFLFHVIATPVLILASSSHPAPHLQKCVSGVSCWFSWAGPSRFGLDLSFVGLCVGAAFAFPRLVLSVLSPHHRQAVPTSPPHRQLISSASSPTVHLPLQLFDCCRFEYHSLNFHDFNVSHQSQWKVSQARETEETHSSPCFHPPQRHPSSNTSNTDQSGVYRGSRSLGH